MPTPATRTALAWLQLDQEQRATLGDGFPALASALDDLARSADGPGGTDVGRRWDASPRRGRLTVERRSGALPPVGSGRPLDFVLVDEGTAPDPSFLTQAARARADLTGSAVIDEVLRVTRQLAHEHRRDHRDPAAVVVSPDVLEAMRKAAARQTGHPLDGIPRHPSGGLWGLPVEEDATLRPGCVGVRDAGGTFTLVALDQDAALGQAVREHRS